MCSEQALLTRLLSGDLPEETRRRAMAHLESCAACREEFEGLREAWDTLGRWTVDPAAPIEFERRVLQAADAERAAAFGRLDWRRYLTRVAAAVVLAAGAGAAAALMMPGPSRQAAQPQAEANQIVEALGLDVLSGESASAFAQLYDTEDSGAIEKEQL
jgi:anti-sigma factor RsiW